MTRFWCPGNCEFGNIVKCSNEANISDRATFTDEDRYPICPYRVPLKKKGKKNKK